MNDMKNALILLLIILYVISPVDFMPGPLDDILLIVLYNTLGSNEPLLD